MKKKMLNNNNNNNTNNNDNGWQTVNRKRPFRHSSSDSDSPTKPRAPSQSRVTSRRSINSKPSAKSLPTNGHRGRVLEQTPSPSLNRDAEFPVLRLKQVLNFLNSGFWLRVYH